MRQFTKQWPISRTMIAQKIPKLRRSECGGSARRGIRQWRVQPQPVPPGDPPCSQRVVATGAGPRRHGTAAGWLSPCPGGVGGEGGFEMSARLGLPKHARTGSDSRLVDRPGCLPGAGLAGRWPAPFGTRLLSAGHRGLLRSTRSAGMSQVSVGTQPGCAADLQVYGLVRWPTGSSSRAARSRSGRLRTRCCAAPRGRGGRCRRWVPWACAARAPR